MNISKKAFIGFPLVLSFYSFLMWNAPWAELFPIFFKQKIFIFHPILYPVFFTLFTIGLFVYSIFSWICYFREWAPETALSGIVQPAALTFLAFSWPNTFVWMSMV